MMFPALALCMLFVKGMWGPYADRKHLTCEDGIYRDILKKNFKLRFQERVNYSKWSIYMTAEIMTKFQCGFDWCQAGLQFCEAVGVRCRDCSHFIDSCFKDNIHISNCSSYCLDILKNNISSQTNSSCVDLPDQYLSEKHHLLIEVILTFLIISIILATYVQRYSVITDIFRRITGQPPTPRMTEVAVDHNVKDTPAKQPLMSHENPEQEQKVPIDPENIVSSGNCGFTQHNQIPNARKDDPSLCVSGKT